MNSRDIAGADECPVRITAGEVMLEGDLCIPENAGSVVVFAHGSGSSRSSPRNRYVARTMRQAGMATLLFDLLTAREEAEERYTAHLRFNIPLLASRLVGATEWLKANTATADFSIGYFGASTGAAAALVAAAELPQMVGAVVSRGGRPDLAESSLAKVKAPTLLIVGGRDYQVIELNQHALNMLKVVKELAIVPGATHLFEEPGALEEVARLASEWFTRHLR